MIEKRVFVSYSRKDSSFASHLMDRLKESKLAVWNDRDLRAGDKWCETIDEAIRFSFAMVVILTPAASESKYVSYEWSFALGAGVKVLPLAINESDSDLHPSLASLHFLKFDDFPTGPWTDLINKLEALSEAHRPITIRLPHKAPPSIREAARHLDSIDQSKRQAAVATLDQMDLPLADDVLEQAVDHPVEDVRRAAARPLARRGKLAALPEILAIIRSRRDKRRLDFEREGILQALTALGPQALPELVPWLDDEDHIVRQAAMAALAKIGDEACLPRLLDATHDENFWNRSAAVEALRAFKGPDVVAALVAAAFDEEWSVRRDAIVSLAMQRDASTFQILVDALEDGHSNVRMAAAYQLGKPGNLAAIPYLHDALIDSDRHVRRAIAVALGVIGGASAIPGLRQALVDGPSMTTSAALEAIERIRDPAAVPALYEIARENSHLDVRGTGNAAVNAIVGIGNPQALSALERLLSESEPPTQRAIIFSVRDERNPDLIPLIVQCLNDPDADVAESAKNALQDSDSREFFRAYKEWWKKNRASKDDTSSQGEAG